MQILGQVGTLQKLLWGYIDERTRTWKTHIQASGYRAQGLSPPEWKIRRKRPWTMKCKLVCRVQHSGFRTLGYWGGAGSQKASARLPVGTLGV